VVKRSGSLVRLYGVDKDADLAAFCRAEWPRLVGSMSLYLGRRDQAEDLAQEALILRYFADLSIAEVAAVMECPENTVKTHVRRACARLRVSGLLDVDDPEDVEEEVG
jgi:DNA-directed RNA polymerase specialized sigma24 family protein